MIFSGDISENLLHLVGSYTAVGAGAPPGPDWSWRITIERADAGSFILRMFNIAPDAQGRADGDGDLAVDAHFHPVATP